MCHLCLMISTAVCQIALNSTHEIVLVLLSYSDTAWNRDGILWDRTSDRSGSIRWGIFGEVKSQWRTICVEEDKDRLSMLLFLYITVMLHERHGVSNHWHFYCLVNSFCRPTPKINLYYRHCEQRWFPLTEANNREGMPWRHHDHKCNELLICLPW